MSASSSPAVDFNPEDIHISVELVPTARNLLEFLAEVSTKPELHEGPSVDCAIQRYERFWLPLVAKNPGRLLPAPLDIEWIWQCHLLAPDKYSQDCERIAGKLIDHHLIDKATRRELLPDSERLWRLEYADVPFSSTDPSASWFDSEFVSTLTYNISSAVTRQRTFFYQVSLPHYRDEKFLTNALLRYKKFLYLKCHHPNVFLVPCYDNDLIWHSHMMFPLYYKDDTQAFLGTLLPHDDSVNDRSKGSKLCVSEAKTRVLWKKVFKEKSSYFGAMFRGPSPYSKLHAMAKEEVYRIATKQTSVFIEKVRITGLPQGKAFKLKLCYNTGYQNFNRSLFVTENIATVKGNSRILEDYRINTSFSFDTRYNDKLIASIQKKSGRLCLGTNDMLGEGKLDLQRKIQPLKNRGLTANDDIDCGDGMSAALVWSCPAPELGPCVFRLEPGQYQGCVMPPDREALWGPIPLPRLAPGSENLCSVASHKLYNHMRKPVFTVRMIHSEPMLMSAIHVFSGNKMTAVAHLIVGDHLPLPSTVSEPKKCVTLNPKEGQRAVLIKNHKGDWGIAVGWWEGLHRRGSGRKGSCSEGHLEVRFFHLPTHKWQYVSFDRLYSLATSKFEIGDCMVEFDSGFIAIDSQRCEISENLALIFSVTLIHVLCQPRPGNWAPGLSSPAPPQGESTPAPAYRLSGSEEITLLIAAGVLIATPCNHAIRNLFKKKKQKFGGESSASAFSPTRFQGKEEEEEREHEATGEQETLEPNGGPAVILHEVEVTPGWDQRKSSRGRIHSTTRLMSITEQRVDEEEEDEENEEERVVDSKRSKPKRLATGNGTKSKVGVGGGSSEGKGKETMKKVLKGHLLKTAVMGKGGDDDGDDDNDGGGGGGGGGVLEDSREEEDEDGEEEEGVFSVEDYSGDGDGQAFTFGNGESDSDEVQAEDDEAPELQEGILLEEGDEDGEGDEEEEQEEERFEEEEEEGEKDEVEVEEEEENKEEEYEDNKEEEEVEEQDEEEDNNMFGLGGGGDGENDTTELYNGMVNGFDDDEQYLDDAESFYNEFYNMEGESNHEAAWGDTADGGMNGGGDDKDNDEVFISNNDHYNGYGDHNSSFGANHNDHDLDRSDQNSHERLGYDYNGHDATSYEDGRGDNFDHLGLPDKGVDNVDNNHSSYSSSPVTHNHSYEGINGDSPGDAFDAGGGGGESEGGACGGCGG